MKGNSKGFTLIELVIVIVILGILAAVAVPKFANLQTDAKKSAVKGLGGAVKAAANIAKAKWLVNDNALADNVTIDGETVQVLTGTGYPKATSDGIAAAIDFDADNFDNSSTCGTLGGDSSSYCFTYTSQTSPDGSDGGCGVYYGVDNADNSTRVIIETGGCQ